MISSVVRDFAGQQATLKFSTRAQARVEREIGETVARILSTLGDRHGVDTVCEIIAASWNDGKGRDVDGVYDLIDTIGQAEAGKIVGELISAAYPPAEKGQKGDDPEKK